MERGYTYNGPWYVSIEGSDDNNGSDSSLCINSKAIDKVDVEGEIFIEPGVYQENY